MDNLDIFKFLDYRKYLEKKVKNLLGKNRGVRTKIAQIANIHSSYLSKIFSGEVNLTLEQACKLSLYFGHSYNEKKHFILLILKERESYHELKIFFNQEILNTQPKKY